MKASPLIHRRYAHEEALRERVVKLLHLHDVEMPQRRNP